MSAKELITEVEYVHKERKLSRRKEELVQLGQAGFLEEVAFQLRGSYRQTDTWGSSHSHGDKGHHRTGQCSGVGEAMGVLGALEC